MIRTYIAATTVGNPTSTTVDPMAIVGIMFAAAILWTFVLVSYMRGRVTEKKGAIFRVRGGKNSGRIMAMSEDGLTRVWLTNLSVRPHLDDEVLDTVKRYKMTPEEKEKQRRSFVYGNVALCNPNVTRKLVNEVANELGEAPR